MKKFVGFILILSLSYIACQSESPGGRLNNTSVDFSDYNAVKQYYNLPD